MKEPVAENRYLLTGELFTEGTLRVWKESGGKAVKRLMALLGLLWLGLAALTLWQGGGPALPITELCVLVLVVLWAAVLLPRSRAKRAYRALEERGGADTERRIRFYEDRLEAEVSGRQTVLAYSDLAQVLHSKNLLILVSGDKTGILVKHDSYLSGTEEEVLRLIHHVNVEEEHTND